MYNEGGIMIFRTDSPFLLLNNRSFISYNKGTDSEYVLFIFQFPATIFFLISVFYFSLMRGSSNAYIISTIILIITNKSDVTNTTPITTGRSYRSSDSITSLPIPSHPKMYSTKTAPAIKLANQPDIAVTTGLSAFFNACLLIILFSFNPLANAVRI